MKDTHPYIITELDRRYKRLSGETRMIMGMRMFEAARDLALASFRNDLNIREKKRALFLRFYSEDFNEEEKQKIIEKLYI